MARPAYRIPLTSWGQVCGDGTLRSRSLVSKEIVDSVLNHSAQGQPRTRSAQPAAVGNGGKRVTKSTPHSRTTLNRISFPGSAPMFFLPP
ncbi:hypothetical protein PHLCEN_2v6237 [Hermanssonia centrifuga]|uniref:Uncharacterized protein n=1 Tax=Hermanssonia centrifuga TaxID=98765 RepID=A0A2R6P018_9APHY|nr:hypothetical protein PHLCEN_2v6237 [Hermanssonia centrifuga]